MKMISVFEKCLFNFDCAHILWYHVNQMEWTWNGININKWFYIQNCFDLFTFREIVCYFLSFENGLSHFIPFTKVISVTTVSLIIIYHDAWLDEYEIEQHDFNANDGNIIPKMEKLEQKSMYRERSHLMQTDTTEWPSFDWI